MKMGDGYRSPCSVCGKQQCHRSGICQECRKRKGMPVKQVIGKDSARRNRKERTHEA